MARLLSALGVGALFGLGLVLSGMTDTVRVQGWLDVFGSWDPTLAFVLGGAILPMAIAWRVAARRPAAALGTPYPGPTGSHLDRGLVIGSLLFGAGWALAGLCPGPAMASLSFGGTGGLVFLLAMAAGMMLAPAVRARLNGPMGRRKSKMDIRRLSDGYAVSPQIAPSDMAALKAAGFARVVCNRPDAENPAELQSAAMKAAAAAVGLDYVYNPVTPGQMNEGNVAEQAKALAGQGPTFAYCASGNRSSQVWALARAGRDSADALIAAGARFGYNLEPLRDRLR